MEVLGPALELVTPLGAEEEEVELPAPMVGPARVSLLELEGVGAAWLLEVEEVGAFSVLTGCELSPLLFPFPLVTTAITATVAATVAPIAPARTHRLDRVGFSTTGFSTTGSGNEPFRRASQNVRILG